MDKSATVPRERRRQFLPPAFVRAMLAGHSALGLAFAALIYVVCLTGTVTVFMHEFARWEQPGGPVVTSAPSAEVVGIAVRQGYDKAVADNAAHDIFISGPSGYSSRFVVNYHDHETGKEGDWLADDAGNLVAPVSSPFTTFVAELHMTLHLPRTWGLFLVGLTGVALLSSLISGLLSHPRLFKDAFHLRWGGSKRLQEADLHNRLGVWGLPFHVAVSLTGALLGLSTLIVGVLAMAAYDGDSGKAFAVILGPQPTEDETAAPVPDVAAMIRAVKAEKPDATFASVHLGHVAKAGQIVTLSMRTPGHLAVADTYSFNGRGERLGSGELETGSIGKQILGALQPVHFGWFGGMPVKLLYGLLGLALTVVTHTGVTIWLARRRDKGRPAPGWERVWAAVGWSQPVALGAAAVAAPLAPGLVLWTYLAVVAGSFLVAAFARDGEATTFVLRVAGAIACLAAVVVHAWTWHDVAQDGMAWWVSAALVAVAGGLAAPAMRRRQTRSV